LSKNNLIHLQPLRALDTLIGLNINYNKVYDISAVADLTNLEELYASNNEIKNISPIGANSHLKIVNFYMNKIQSSQDCLSTFKKLASLTEIDIENNPVYD
jgi:internalin A